MRADAFEGVGERLEFPSLDVLGEVFLDAATVDGPCRSECLESFGGDVDEDDAPVVCGAFAVDESGFFHFVDDAGEAASAEEDSACELVHAQPVLGAFEVDECVVPVEGESALCLQFGVEDVDQRVGGLEEHPPGGELFSVRA